MSLLHASSRRLPSREFHKLSRCDPSEHKPVSRAWYCAILDNRSRGVPIDRSIYQSAVSCEPRVDNVLPALISAGFAFYGPLFNLLVGHNSPPLGRLRNRRWNKTAPEQSERRQKCQRSCRVPPNILPCPWLGFAPEKRHAIRFTVSRNCSNIRVWWKFRGIAESCGNSGYLRHFCGIFAIKSLSLSCSTWDWMLWLLNHWLSILTINDHYFTVLEIYYSYILIRGCWIFSVC